MSLFAAASQGVAPVLDVLREGRNAANKTVQGNIAADQQYYSMRNANIAGLMEGASPLVSQLGGQFGTAISGIFSGSNAASAASLAQSQMASNMAPPASMYPSGGLYGFLGPQQQMAVNMAPPASMSPSGGLYGFLGPQQQMAVNMAPPSNMGGPLNFGSFI